MCVQLQGVGIARRWFDYSRLANAVYAEEEISREELEDLKKTMGPNEMPAIEKDRKSVV